MWLSTTPGALDNDLLCPGQILSNDLCVFQECSESVASNEQILKLYVLKGKKNGCFQRYKAKDRLVDSVFFSLGSHGCFPYIQSF